MCTDQFYNNHQEKTDMYYGKQNKSSIKSASLMLTLELRKKYIENQTVSVDHN